MKSGRSTIINFLFFIAFTKTIIPLTLVECGIIIANSAQSIISYPTSALEITKDLQNVVVTMKTKRYIILSVRLCLRIFPLICLSYSPLYREST